MERKIRVGDYVIADINYTGWADWYMDEYVRPKKPIRVLDIRERRSLGMKIDVISPYNGELIWDSDRYYIKIMNPCPMGGET